MKPNQNIETETRENLIFRAPTMDDLPAAVQLFNLSSLDLIGQEEFDLADVGTDWGTPGYNLETDARVLVTPQGEMLAYVEVFDLAPHVQVFVWGRVHPDYRGRGYGTRLMRWAESRARQAIPKAPPGARVVFAGHALCTNEGAGRLLADRGFRLVRKFFRMEVELAASPAPPVWPAGQDGAPLQVRAMRPGEEADVIRVKRETFQDHWGYVDRPFEEELARWRHWMEKSGSDFDPSLWFLALDGKEIAGVSLCWPKAPGGLEMGWVQILGVRRPWRRRGLGLALLHHTFGEFYRRGQPRVGLGVDADSLTGATRLYEKAGMHVAREQCAYEKELRPGEELSLQTLVE